MSRRTVSILMAVTIGVSTLAGCQTVVAGARCRSTELAQDATHVLKCVKGRWRRVTTKENATRAIVALINSRTTTTTTPPPAPTAPPTTTTTVAPAPPYVASLATNYQTACALISNGTVRCWGKNSSGQATGGTVSSMVAPTTIAGVTGVTKVAIGDDHGCAIVAGGQIRCWGANDHGQLGNGTLAPSSVPVTVTDDSSNPLTGYTLIAAGASHTCAAKGDTIRCWGANDQGQDGTNRTSDELTATPVQFGLPISGHDVLNLVSFYHHTCASVSGLGAYCWGNNSNGQLGSNSVAAYRTTANLVQQSNFATPSETTQITVGDQHSCVVMTDGSVRCWGQGSNGQLAHGTDMTAYNNIDPATAVRTGAGTYVADAIGISAGSNHTCITRAGGSVLCWGQNNKGQLANGSSSSTPYNPSYATFLPAGPSYTSTPSGGGQFTCFLTSDHVVRCVGNDSNGELGHGVAGPTYGTPIVVNVLP